MSIPKPDLFVERINNTVRKFGMLSGGESIVVAVSGGPDSVCLLGVLHDLARELDLTLHVAHLDHMFRGAESAREAQFVATLAKKFQIPAVIEAVDVPAYCRERGLSAQPGARDVRYEFLSRVAAGTGASRIATGHTADDQAETMLLRLLRGAGLPGLSGIPPMRGNIIRPLIETARAEVLEYLHSRSLDYVSDSSNTKPVYARNRIRIELLPVLKQFNPRIVETLAAEASLIRDEEEDAEFRITEIVQEVLIREQDRVVLERGKFNTLSRAMQRRVLRRAVDAAAAEAIVLSFVQVEEALSFLALAQSGKRLDLPGGLTLSREYEQFIISTVKEAPRYNHALSVPGTIDVPEAGLVVEARLLEADSSDPARIESSQDTPGGIYFWQAQFDYDKINEQLQIRTRRQGDWFCPSGMGGKSKKLQDFFVDAKVPKRRRDFVPLLASADAVLWVVGFRTDDRFRAGAGTRRVLTVTVRTTER
jgi:tRNA(Ile)-lysidine synthase